MFTRLSMCRPSFEFEQIERHGEWFIAYCLEIPGGNGQGRTKGKVRESLAQAILADRREDALRGIPPDAIREIVTVK
jgi:hypothetical protein